MSRIFGVDTFRLDFSVVLGLPWERWSTAQGGCNVDRKSSLLPEGFRLTTIIPTSHIERTCFEFACDFGVQRDNRRRRWLSGGASCVGIEKQSERAGAIFKVLLRSRRWKGSGYNCRFACVGLAGVVDNCFAGSGKQITGQREDVAALMPRLLWKKWYPRVDTRHEVDVFHWCDHQFCTGSSRRFVLRRCCRLQLQRHDGRSRCELCRMESPCVRRF